MQTYSLADLGWSAHFLNQLTPDDLTNYPAARLTSVHRARVEALAETGPRMLFLRPDMPMADLAVGDWVLIEDHSHRVHRRLDRTSLLQRRAAGTGAEVQLIAANLDTLFIVSSCNADLNIARLERFLILAAHAEVEPVIVLTKADTCPDPQVYVEQAQTLQRGLRVVAVDARSAEGVAPLTEWCTIGRTVALLGSSGVGKSTLANALGAPLQDTGGIREDDAKGRHTTTRRNLLAIPGGGWLIDTPGMRELQLADVGDGIGRHFSDLSELAADCKFRNCTHAHEPGCAVQAAIAAGEIDADRLARWRKLEREDKFNTQTLFEARTVARTAGKLHRKTGAKYTKR